MASAAERRRAQRQLAKDVHAGLYSIEGPHRTAAGRAYEKARARQWIKVGRSGKHHHQRRFNTLDNALNFATTLSPNYHFYIIGRGEFADPSKYGKDRGEASLNNWHEAGTTAYQDQSIRDNDEAIFTSATSYYVRWSNNGD